MAMCSMCHAMCVCIALVHMYFFVIYLVYSIVMYASQMVSFDMSDDVVVMYGKVGVCTWDEWVVFGIMGRGDLGMKLGCHHIAFNDETFLKR